MNLAQQILVAASQMPVPQYSTVQDEKRRWVVDSFYFLNVTPERDGRDASNTKNQANVLVRRDWLRSAQERWTRMFGFTQLRYAYDEFQQCQN